jgi:hypothetical protein
MFAGDAKTTSEQEANDKYERFIACSILTLDSFIGM